MSDKDATSSCPTCGTPLRKILIKEEVRGFICVECNPPEGTCPLCGGKLRTEKAQQCPHCFARWHKPTPVLPIEKRFVDPIKRPPPQQMSHQDFEDYVEFVISTLDFCKIGNVYRNRRYQGKHQPGKYEIDIAIEFWLHDALSFLVIIECKNWKRPVDRPLIQKLIQTRDAIGAQKAVMVSPVGFTREAANVAKTNGVALWVVACETLGVFGAALSQRRITFIYRELFKQLCLQLRDSLDMLTQDNEQRKVLAGWKLDNSSQPELAEWSFRYKHQKRLYVAPPYSLHRLVGSLGIRELNRLWISEILAASSNAVVQQAVDSWRRWATSYLLRMDWNTTARDSFIESVLQGTDEQWRLWCKQHQDDKNYESFFRSLDESVPTYLDPSF